MSKLTSDNIFDKPQLLRQYVEGKLHENEAIEFEEVLNEDAFLREAAEGLQDFFKAHSEEDLDEMRKSTIDYVLSKAEHYQPPAPSPFRRLWWALFGIIGLSIFIILAILYFTSGEPSTIDPSEQTPLPMESTIKVSPVVADSKPLDETKKTIEVTPEQTTLSIQPSKEINTIEVAEIEPLQQEPKYFYPDTSFWSSRSSDHVAMMLMMQDTVLAVEKVTTYQDEQALHFLPRIQLGKGGVYSLQIESPLFITKKDLENMAKDSVNHK